MPTLGRTAIIGALLASFAFPAFAQIPLPNSRPKAAPLVTGSTSAPQQQQMAQQQAQPQAAPAPASSPMMDQLNQLAQMHTAGILDDAEFAAAKQRLLSGG